MALLTLSGISARSLTFSSGISTVLMPPRSAASSFSFRPPIAVTSPRSVISPVMATSARTGMPLRADTSAVVIAAPALGPSLGVAPSGTWMWISRFSNTSSRIPSERARLRTTVRAASTDSFITSPSEPVRLMTPLPGMAAASIVSRSPPTSVHARPTTWPTWFFCSAWP
ncbi:hypothetical protein D3C72_1690870 [compost metagenome]